MASELENLTAAQRHKRFIQDLSQVGFEALLRKVGAIDWDYLGIEVTPEARSKLKDEAEFIVSLAAECADKLLERLQDKGDADFRRKLKPPRVQ